MFWLGTGLQERIEAVTLIGRRKLEIVPEQYKVDLAAEEASGRLKQHVQGKRDGKGTHIVSLNHAVQMLCCAVERKRAAGQYSISTCLFIDLDAVTEDTVKELSAGYQVFFNTLGTTRRQAGSAVSARNPSKCFKCVITSYNIFLAGSLPSYRLGDTSEADSSGARSWCAALQRGVVTRSRPEQLVPVHENKRRGKKTNMYAL